jgi:hypothetical protein
MNEHTGPDPDVAALAPLVGEWRTSGEATGSVRYEWMEGGHFLLQHVDLTQDGQRNVGIEVIGRLRPFMGEPTADIKSRFYGSNGETYDYTYELVDGTLTIWGGDRGSPAYYRGTFSEDGDTLTGAWVYPGGGGYEAVQTRVKR